MTEETLDNDALVSLADLATMAGVTRPAVSNWRRRHTDFPAPKQESGTTTLFRFGDIKYWMAKHGKRLAGRSAEQAVWTALNPARGVVLPEDAAEAGMAILGCAVAAAYVGDSVEDILGRIVESDPATLQRILSDLAYRTDQAGIPNLIDRKLFSLPHWADYAIFFQEVARLASEFGPADVFEALLTAGSRGFRGAGEFATPPSIARLLTALLSAHGTVLDFACGQGTLLLSAAQTAKPGKLKLIGQDINYSVHRVAQVRMLVHGIDADITHGDTLNHDTHPELQADLILADPPFGMHWSPERDPEPGRWKFGVPPRSKADFAWVQHAITRLRPGGRAVIVTSLGPLFRGGAEAEIRRALVGAGCVHAVISLPSGLYPTTGIPVAIMILGCPQVRDPSDVLLVDASQLGKSHRGRHGLSDDDIDRILTTVRSSELGQDVLDQSVISSIVVPVGTLLAGDCSLIPSRWVEATADYSQLIDRVLDSERRLLEASHSLTQDRATFPNVVPANDSAGPLLDILGMAERGLIAVIRSRRIESDVLGTGTTPLIRAKDVGPGLTVAPSESVDLGLLPRSTELTQPGDVLVVTEGRIRAAVDRVGGAVVASPVQIVRPRSNAIDAVVLAATISHYGQRQATGTTIPRIDLNSLEIPVLGVESARRLQAVLYELDERRQSAISALEAIDGLADALVLGLSSGSLRFSDEEPRAEQT